MRAAGLAVGLAALIVGTHARLEGLDLLGGDGQESGFLPVNGGQMFYWFFEARNGDRDAPLLIWLQGGPGGSGMEGLFFEVGPLYLDENLDVSPRKYSWNNQFNQLFVDNPIGTGYSYVYGEDDYSNSEEAIAENLIAFMLQFYNAYPDLADNALFLTGESYAGKYIPAFSYAIVNYNAGSPDVPIPLEGFALGDSLIDPCSQVLTKPDAAYVFGLVDGPQREEAQAYAKLANDACGRQQWRDALQYRDSMESVVSSASDINLYDVSTFDKYYQDWDDRLDVFLNEPTVKARLNVGNHTWATDDGVYNSLEEDIMKSQAFKMPTVWDAGIRTLFYQGGFDWKDGPSSNEQWLRRLPWDGLEAYNSAERIVWAVNGAKAGFVKSSGVLTELVGPAAGHFFPYNQPERAFEMITLFVNNMPFESA